MFEAKEVRVFWRSNWWYEKVRWPALRAIAILFLSTSKAIFRIAAFCATMSYRMTPPDGKGPLK